MINVYVLVIFVEKLLDAGNISEMVEGSFSNISDLNFKRQITVKDYIKVLYLWLCVHS